MFEPNENNVPLNKDAEEASSEYTGQTGYQATPTPSSTPATPTYHEGNGSAYSNGSASSNGSTYSQVGGYRDTYSPKETTSYHSTGASQGNYTGTTGYSSTGSNVPPVTYSTQPGASYQGASYQEQQKNSYTWNTQGTPPQGPGGYYAPQPQPKKPKKKGKAGKTLLKVAAGVVCAAVISAGSVGTFVALIQNGTINIKANESEKTAAFTINKVVDDTQSTNVSTTGLLTPQEVAEKVIPSVVCVQNYQIVQQDGGFAGFYDFSQGGQGGGTEASEVSPVSEGSGIIISKDGYIVTNEHVVAGATSLKVVTNEGLTYEAELVGKDNQTDLAVLKINTTDELTPASFGTSEDLTVADEVMAIGNPGGLQLNSSVTMGYISALNRPVENSETGYSVNCIQTDAAINPGNSGGALVDLYGNVVGINSSKIVATGYEGLGFAIPSDIAQPIVSDLIEHGYVKDRPMLGVSGQYIDSLTASFYGLSQGFYIQSATSEAAIAAGLQRGDVITAIDDTQVTSAGTIATYIADKKPGDEVTLSIFRGANGQTLQVKLALSENSGED